MSNRFLKLREEGDLKATKKRRKLMFHRLFLCVASTGATGLEPSPTAPYLRGNRSSIASFFQKSLSRKASHMAQYTEGSRATAKLRIPSPSPSWVLPFDPMLRRIFILNTLHHGYPCDVFEKHSFMDHTLEIAAYLVLYVLAFFSARESWSLHDSPQIIPRTTNSSTWECGEAQK